MSKFILALALTLAATSSVAQQRLPGQIARPGEIVGGFPKATHQPIYEPYQVQRTSPWGIQPSHEFIERNKQPADIFSLDSKQEDIHTHSSSCLFSIDGCD